MRLTPLMKMMLIFGVTIAILALVYSGLFFGLSIEQIDHFIIVFTAVSLFATLVLLLPGQKRGG